MAEGSGNNPLAANSLLGGIIASTVVIGVNAGVRRLADAIAGDPLEIEAQKYELMHRRLSERNFYIPPAAQDSAPVSRVRSVARQMPVKRIAIAEAGSPVMEHVRASLKHLDEAKASTTCGVCKKHIDAAKQQVVEQSEVIVRADAKQQVMRQLKAAGKLPQKVRWDQLKPEQKHFIDKVVERSIKNG